MQTVNVAILLSIGNFIGWIAALYVKNAERGLIGHVIVSTIGAFIAGYLALTFASQYGVPGMMIAAFIGSALLLYFVRFRKWHRG